MNPQSPLSRGACLSSRCDVGEVAPIRRQPERREAGVAGRCDLEAELCRTDDVSRRWRTVGTTSAAAASNATAKAIQASRPPGAVAVATISAPAPSNAPSSASRASPMSRSRCFGSFCHTAPQQCPDEGRRGDGSAVPVGLVLEDRDERVGGILPVECARPREHLVEHARRTPRCRCACRPVCRAPARATCRPPCRGSSPICVIAGDVIVGEFATLADVAGRFQRLRQAEVEHLHRAVGAHLDVRRLQVAVDDALLVRGLERVGDLPRDRQGVLERNRAARNALRQSPRPPPVPSPARRDPHSSRARKWPRCWGDSGRRASSPRARSAPGAPRPARRRQAAP